VEPGKLSIHNGKQLDVYDADEEHDLHGNRHITLLPGDVILMGTPCHSRSVDPGQVVECEITGIGRVWADGKPMDMTGVTWRWYPGNEAQAPDPFISAKMGAANTPAYRGTAYVVFEDLALATFGNRLPQLSFEVFRPLADPDTAEGLTRAVTLIPASGEFTYATEAVRKTVGATTTVFGQTTGGTTSAENLNALPDEADIVVALDRLIASSAADLARSEPDDAWDLDRLTDEEVETLDALRRKARPSADL
jgi:hypothetical protein